jgi:two-component system nitrogen regulation sensor histidine kinase NtrY
MKALQHLTSTVSHSPQTVSSPLRRKRTRRIIFGLLFLLLVTTSAEVYLHSFRTSSLIANDILIFVMFNLNIILLIVLIILVFRNLLKVYFEHRSKVLGAKFRTKLITAFVGLALFPSILLFLFASGLITTSIENWFNIQVEKSLQDSLDVARSYAWASETNALSFGTELSQLMTDQRMLLPVNAHYLRNTIRKKRQEFFLDGIQVYASDLQEIATVFEPYVPDDVSRALTPEQLQGAFAGRPDSHIAALGNGDVIRALVPVWSPGRDTVEGVVVITYYLPRRLVTKLRNIVQTFDEYQQLKNLKGPVQGSYVVTFLIVTLLIIFSAIWVGLQLAKSITIPIQQLAEGTRLVANGNLDFTINVASDDEIGLLVASFNQMTRDLKQSNMALEQANAGLQSTNIELDRRRSYMETVLENIAAGVISIDNHGRVTTINKAAAELLELSVAHCLGRLYRQVFDVSYLKPFLDLIRTMHTDHTNSRQEQRQVVVKGKSLTLLVSLTFLKDSHNNSLGIVVVFDDLTALIKAQKTAAWHEVARGLAHEIKNPLTPIQLSAQRLQKKFLEGTADRTLVGECTTTIIRQVAGLKSLVNEFSQFARLPEAQPTPQDLHAILDEVITLYSGTYNGLRLTVAYDPLVPPLELDREQIRRVFINLVENSVEAMQGKGDIHIVTRLCPARRVVQIELSDTGPGIPEKYHEQLFEPYFSTKKRGTGLGLSLVHRIVTDHHGSIAVSKTHAAGATFLIELPVTSPI